MSKIHWQSEVEILEAERNRLKAELSSALRREVTLEHDRDLWKAIADRLAEALNLCIDAERLRQEGKPIPDDFLWRKVKEAITDYEKGV